jgi:hypothetical protein
LAYKRIAGSEEILVVANFSSSNLGSFPLELGKWESLPISGYQDNLDPQAKALQIVPSSVVVLRKK